MNRLWMGAGVVGAAVLLSSCDDFQGFNRAQQEFHYSYGLQPGGHLDVENVNGSVDITGWDRNSIEVSGTKSAPSEDQLKDIQIKVSVSGNTASITTEAPRDHWGGGFGARYFIRVPREIALGRVQTTNGSFSVEDLQGGGNVKSTNGRISMARDSGDYEVHTTNGSIDLEECSGDERAETTNGGIRGRLKTGAIDANSTNGAIDFTILKPQDDKALRVSTTNGSLMLALAELHGNSVRAETTHGSVTLRLPGDANAQISARTSFAKITTDLAFSSTDEMSKHELRAQLGHGGPPISARTTTGSIRIERY